MVMDRSEFERNLLLFGSNMAQWDDPTGAAELLEEDAVARALLEEAQAMDANLATALAYAPLDRAELDRLHAIVGGRHVRWVSGRQMIAASAMLLCIGWGGFVLGQTTALDAARTDATLIALASGELDMLGELQ